MLTFPINFSKYLSLYNSLPFYPFLVTSQYLSHDRSIYFNPIFPFNFLKASSPKGFTDMASSSKEGKNCEGKLKYEDMTPLQKHVAFFDRNKDGLIYPWETFQGMRAIGAGIGLSTVSAIFINGALSPKTSPGKFPSLLFPIYVENISKGKHGSDSGVYDSEGRFVPEKFEEIFKKYAKTKPDALTSKELEELLQGNKEPADSKGHFAAKVEWKVLHLLAKDKDGFLSKDIIRGTYDGSLFLKMEQERSSSQKKSCKE